MRDVFSKAFGLLLIAVLVCSSVFAQGTAQINGSVKDSTGAVLPGVEITVTQTDTNRTRIALSDETGAFILPSLPIGPYKVEATLPGFRTFVQTGIVLGVNQNPTIGVVLEVGQVTEQVEVQANVTMVETRNLGIRQVIENAQILELPLNGRNATDLIMLQGGAVANGQNAVLGRALNGGVGVSISGLSGQTTYTLDGALHTNPQDNLNLPLPFPDALQEFSIQTGTQNATGGFQGGSTVGAVTKSGTNQFHGDVFDYYRNDRFMARSYFAATKGTRKRNEAGGTLGGPIIQNKLFFFGGYDRLSNSAAPTDSIAAVPTPRMLSGDFSQVAKAYGTTQTGGYCSSTAVNATGTGATPGLLRLTDSPNFINPARFSKAALAIVHLLPQVNGMAGDTTGTTRLPLSLWPDNKMQPGHSGAVGTDECGRVFYSNNSGSRETQIIGKVDYQRTATHTIFGRVFFTPQYTDLNNDLEANVLGFKNAVNLGGSGQDKLGSFYTIGDTYLLSPSSVNTLAIAVNRTSNRRFGPQVFDVSDVGINAYTYLPKTFYISGAGFSGQGGTNVEGFFGVTTYNLSDSVSLVRGNHQLSFGGSLAAWKLLQYTHVRSVPTFTFTVTAGDPTSTGLAAADFLLGKFTQMRQSAPNGQQLVEWYAGFHAADTWKMSSRFTVNAGLRWEPYFPQEQIDGHIYNFSYDRMLSNQKSTVFANAPAGFTYPGDPGFQSRAGMGKDWKILEPRIGFGWDPTGKGKTSIRASYGLSQSFIAAHYHVNTNVAPPFGNDNIVSPTGKATLDNPWVDFPGGPGFTPGVSPFPYDNSTKNKNVGFTPGGLFVPMSPDQKTTNVQSWSLTVQREMPLGLFVSAQYTGNVTRHIWSTHPLNPAIFVPGTGASTGGCMVPDGKGGTQSILVAAATVSSLAAARTSTAACSSTANTNFRRILSLTRADVAPYVADLDPHDSGGNGSYNGLVITVRRQATRNLNASGNYTWSHCIAEPGSLTAQPNVATGNTFFSINGKDPGTPSTAFFDLNGNFLPGTSTLLATPVDRSWNRANCGTDRRHRFVNTIVAQTPRFGNTILRMVATGWKVSSIYQWSTGSYLSVAGGGDIARIGGGTSGQLAVQLSPNVYTPGKPHGPLAQYLAPIAGVFAAPETGLLSPNHGQSNIVGPPQWGWDASIARTFQVREGQRVEARVEAFNVTNSFRASNPSTTITGSTYGIISASQAPRDMQFALRYIF